MNPWDKIFEKKFSEALKIADDNYKANGQKFDLNSRAICNLQIGNYQMALADFLEVLEFEKKTGDLSDKTYMNIGLSYYALSDFEKAKEYFKFPVINPGKIKYTNGIFRPSSILYFIALKLQDDIILKAAKKDMIKRKLLVHNYLLELEDEQSLNSDLKQIENVTLLNRSSCTYEFYKAVRSFKNKDNDGFKKHLSETVKLEGKFLEFEYFIAKIELESNNG
jgi:tetratricopeptide (TPR) repeat protein